MKANAKPIEVLAPISALSKVVHAPANPHLVLDCAIIEHELGVLKLSVAEFLIPPESGFFRSLILCEMHVLIVLLVQTSTFDRESRLNQLTRSLRSNKRRASCRSLPSKPESTSARVIKEIALSLHLQKTVSPK
jgi:hypothetical protein